MSAFAQTLRDLVTIQAPAGRDAIGQPIPGGWVEFAKVWADILHTGGMEAIKAGAVTSTVQASIRLRQRAGLHAGMRVLHDGTIYKVLAVLPDKVRRQYLDLVCEITK
ncbi:head-tail adaptor protein [Massilia violaceinigra]|uniref:Head-tail adaptor protein n=1 Tax=Massilia violaceinigra TaxID=2045208 RepID=A0A2D2DSE1_9BURK|nr:phage head closure protein [Massilia violaceinigra]ATQ77900.1 head-tail adaptor protein [Massilia violaceinigra]